MSLCTWNSFNFFVWFGGFLFEWKLLMYCMAFMWILKFLFDICVWLLGGSWRTACWWRAWRWRTWRRCGNCVVFVLAVCLLCLKSCQCFRRRGVQCTVYNYKLSVELVGAWTSRASTKRFFMLFLKINTTVNCHL